MDQLQSKMLDDQLSSKLIDGWCVSLQMIGAVGGALAILEVMPKKYAHMLGGPKLKVPLSVGLVAETVLTFALTLTVLWVILRGPRNPSVKTGIIVVATIVLVMAGGAYTGPAMNPANVSFFFTLFHFMVRSRDCS
jgi:glycerol uptake facilitator-like aquaporin